MRNFGGETTHRTRFEFKTTRNKSRLLGFPCPGLICYLDQVVRTATFREVSTLRVET